MFYTKWKPFLGKTWRKSKLDVNIKMIIYVNYTSNSRISIISLCLTVNGNTNLENIENKQ